MVAENSVLNPERYRIEDGWKPYCEGRGMRWPKEVKSAFRPVVLWVLNQAKHKTGENHTSKASMIAGCPQLPGP